MAVYKGPLNVISDGQGGAVIAVTLNPGDIPSDGLTIDVSILQTPAGQQFGNILGLTVDANSSNVTSGLLSIAFAGGSNLTRAANGGTTQVYKVVGQCQRITLFNLAWSTGPINVVLWNTSPANELTSAVNVQATITAGSITFTNSQIQIEHTNSQIAVAATNILPTGATTRNLLVAGTVGIIRSIDVRAVKIQAFGQPGSIGLVIRSIGGPPVYYTTNFAASNENVPLQEIVSLSVLAIPFTSGLEVFIFFNAPLLRIDDQSLINVVVGWTVT